MFLFKKNGHISALPFLNTVEVPKTGIQSCRRFVRRQSDVWRRDGARWLAHENRVNKNFRIA